MGPSISGRRSRRNRLSPDSPPRRKICAVTVVPMLAPIIMAAAWYRFMMPTLTKPTMSTVVTPELWISAVAAAPMPTLTSRLSAVFPNSSLIFPVASCSMLEVSRWTPTRKTPVPASSRTAKSINSANVIAFLTLLVIYPSCIKKRDFAAAARQSLAISSQSRILKSY